jgi:Flp pilus assembly protein TadD
VSNPNDDLRKCPFCAEWIKRQALICRYCDSQVPPESLAPAKVAPRMENARTNEDARPEYDRQRASSSSKPLLAGVALVVAVFAIVIGGIALTSQHKESTSKGTSTPETAKSVATERNLNADPGVTQTSLAPTQATVTQAENEAVQNDLANASDFASTLTQNPDEATRVNKLGLTELKAKNYAKAAAYFLEALSNDSTNAKYASNLGFAEMFTGDLGSAKTHLLTSLKIDPNRSVAWGDIGEVYAKQGNQDAAVYCLLKGYEVSNGDTLGYLKSLDQDPDQSIVTAGRLALAKLGPTVKQEAPPATTALVEQADSEADQGKAHHSIAYKNFWLGMSLEEFEKIPLPSPSCRLVKEQTPQQDVLTCRFDGGDLSIAHCGWVPTFMFLKVGTEFQLVGIEGDCQLSDIDKIGGALAYKYGEAYRGTDCWWWYISPDKLNLLENVNRMSDPCKDGLTCFHVDVRATPKKIKQDATTSEQQDFANVSAHWQKILNGDSSETIGHVGLHKYPEMCELVAKRDEGENQKYKQDKQDYVKNERQSHSGDAHDL